MFREMRRKRQLLDYNECMMLGSKEFVKTI